MTLHMVEFTPVAPDDDEAVACFNALRCDAVGMRQPTRQLTPDGEWNSFPTHHKDAQDYIGAFVDTAVAVAARVRFIRQGRTADLLSIVVAPELRSRSLGTQALSQVESTCRQKRMHSLRITALESAQSFYDNNGYETVGRDHHYVLMRKQLETSDELL
jgi:N-acetylglutamate synthase-like GNAT family acetyltransferase